MKGVRADLANRTVRAQAGVRLGELDRETQAFGLAVPAGVVTHTGLAGLTLGGGIGWLMRKYDLTIDELRSVDLVTADGELVTASVTENSDLFWGVPRGRGKLRHRHRVRVPAQPGRSRGPRWAGDLADGAIGRGVALLPRTAHAMVPRWESQSALVVRYVDTPNRGPCWGLPCRGGSNDPRPRARTGACST
jgi:hypothetical protein